MDLTKLVNIKNRSTASVGYTLPDSGVRRNWESGEIKKGITVGELEQVTYVPGGLVILQDYLQINDKEVCDFLGIEMEPEYFYGDAEIRTLLATGSFDQFLDCLDFAPDGVLDLIKKLSIETKLNDISKRNAIKERLGLDVTAAIANAEYANSKEEDSNTAKTRRSTPVGEAAKTASNGRRSGTPVAATPAIPTYNRVK